VEEAAVPRLFRQLLNIEKDDIVRVRLLLKI
jgi:hypothetical protein